MFTTCPLFGRFHSRLQNTIKPLRDQPLHRLKDICAHKIDPALLAPNQSGNNSRQSIFIPELTFFGFLEQTLNPGTSCRKAAAQIRAYHQADGQDRPMPSDNSAFCQARSRWELERLIAIRRHLAARSSSSGTVLAPELAALLRPVKVVDGTSLNLPDTPANRAAYPQSGDQIPGCGFPLVNMVGLFCLRTGAILERAYGAFRTSENALFEELWPTLLANDILVADRNFASYSNLARLRAKGIDSIFHLHASRNADFRHGKRLARWERLITWTKSRIKPANLTPEQWNMVPQTLEVRLIRFRPATQNGRCKKITLVTTLLDPTLWPAAWLADLYARRWKIELYWDDIKTTLQMDKLSCLSPEMAHKELEMHLIAYNLIRSIMNEAAICCHVPLDRMSFKGTLDTLGVYSQMIEKIPRSYRQRRRHLYMEMLATIAKDQVPQRPDRREPRCQKRRPKAYPFMIKPRHKTKDRPKNLRLGKPKKLI